MPALLKHEITSSTSQAEGVFLAACRLKAFSNNMQAVSVFAAAAVLTLTVVTGASLETGLNTIDATC